MKSKNGLINRILRLTPIFLLAAVVALTAVSCGESAEETRNEEYSVKLPPGATEGTITETPNSEGAIEAQEVDQERGEEQAQEEKTDSNAAGTGVAAYFDGIYISVLSATRQDSNATVLTSGEREVAGDYLEIELAMENVGDELVDLSDYSFRFWNPAIDAGQYYEYYGNDGTYGKYVSENIISATLLEYATLQPINLKLKIGEPISDVFFFLDLNPRNTAANEGFLMEYANLIIHNDNTGEEVQVNLAAFAG